MIRGITAEHEARIALAVAGDADDPTTGRFIAEHGAIETVRLASSTGRLPKGMNTQITRNWHEMMRARLDDNAFQRATRLGEQLNMTVLIPGDERWPEGLEDLGQGAPIVLWARGDTAMLLGTHRNRIALVGARASTGYGEHVTRETVADLVTHGHPIVSGGAYGIDAAAHRAALTVGGATIAIMAGGLDRYYPSGNQSLFEKIQDRGLMLSENPPGASPTKHRFLQRNRLIATLSGLTVVVECGGRSGTLNTASHALRLGRGLAAFPGPVTSATSVGAHQLIRAGHAYLVTDALEVREALSHANEAAALKSRTPGVKRDGLAAPDRFGRAASSNEGPAITR